MIRCLVDQTDHATREDLHKHLRRLHVKQETYYTDFAPQRDLGSRAVIPFKSPVERYLKTEFADKNSLKRFLKEQPTAGREWAIKWLRNRKEEKGLVYPPSQVELRTLMAPGIAYYNHVGGYGAICEGLGFRLRFDTAVPSRAPHDCTPPEIVMIDTRERDPLGEDDEMKVPAIRAKLNCGDYGLPAHLDQGVYIERKSLSDFVGTLSDRETRQGDSNLSRFTRELERAEEVGSYLVMLVENDINTALGFNHMPHIKAKVRAEHVFKNLRVLLERFPLTFQTLFVKGRPQAAAAVVRILGMGAAAKALDLQFAFESGDLL